MSGRDELNAALRAAGRRGRPASLGAQTASERRAAGVDDSTPDPDPQDAAGEVPEPRPVADIDSGVRGPEPRLTGTVLMNTLLLEGARRKTYGP
jgi:hypothetical protein